MIMQLHALQTEGRLHLPALFVDHDWPTYIASLARDTKRGAEPPQISCYECFASLHEHSLATLQSIRIPYIHST